MKRPRCKLYRDFREQDYCLGHLCAGLAAGMVIVWLFMKWWR